MKQLLEFLKALGGAIFQSSNLKYVPVLLLVALYIFGDSNKPTLDRLMGVMVIIVLWLYISVITIMEKWDKRSSDNNNYLHLLLQHHKQVNMEREEYRTSMLEELSVVAMREDFDKQKHSAIYDELIAAGNRETAGMTDQEREMYFNKSNQAEKLKENKFKEDPTSKPAISQNLAKGA